MGETVAETLTEIERTRAALEADIDVLFERLPAREVIVRQAKVYGAAAAGTAVVVAVATVRAKTAGELRAKRRDARINAEELARAFATAPEGARAEDGEGGARLGLAALVAAVLGVAIAYVQARRS